MANAYALDDTLYRMTVQEFLDMDFGDAKVELENGLVRMMAGGGEPHARIAANIIAFLHPALRGTGCRPYGSDLAAQTAHDTIRFPDVSVYCREGPSRDPKAKLIGDPRVVVEILSPGTKRYDGHVKLPEYCEVPGIQEILLVDPDTLRVRHVRRTGPEGWADDLLPQGSDVVLASLNITLPHDEIFAED